MRAMRLGFFFWTISGGLHLSESFRFKQGVLHDFIHKWHNLEHFWPISSQFEKLLLLYIILCYYYFSMQLLLSQHFVTLWKKKTWSPSSGMCHVGTLIRKLDSSLLTSKVHTRFEKLYCFFSSSFSNDR